MTCYFTRSQRAILLTFLSILLLSKGFAQAKLTTEWTDKVIHATTPLAEYPRPQMQRADWLCLNGQWDYQGGKGEPDALHPDRVASFEGVSAKILVPFCPESFLSGVEKIQEINMWYKRSFEVPAAWKDKQILLHFDAVDHDATLFINGRKVGAHSGAYDSFQFNITPFLKKGSNTLILAAHDPNDGKAPSGKNGPRGDYTFSSGIWAKCLDGTC